jgi:hypothetical protein
MGLILIGILAAAGASALHLKIADGRNRDIFFTHTQKTPHTDD